jgi:hypothetical protein
MKETTLTIEQSLESIAFRLDELTGNAMGNSYLKLYMEPVELSGIEEKLDEVNTNLVNINDSLQDVVCELSHINDIAQTLENFLGWYIEFNQTKKSK